jgi:hypothetical protein
MKYFACLGLDQHSAADGMQPETTLNHCHLVILKSKGDGGIEAAHTCTDDKDICKKPLLTAALIPVTE